MSDLNEKLSALASKLGITAQSNEENRKPEVTTITWTEGMDGSAVDWSEYDIDTENLRVYNRAKFHSGNWYYPYQDYKTINAPVSKIAEELVTAVNDGGWRLLSVTSNGAGMQVCLLTRTVPSILPLPQRIDKLPPASPEDFDDKSTEWAQKEMT